MTEVFISYSHKDSQYAHLLMTDLRRHGFDVWIDHRIDYGSKWPVEIGKHLDDCRALIVILSSNSKYSDWVQNELVYAQGKKKIIFPLLLDGEIWLPLASTQYIDVRSKQLPPKEFYEKLKQLFNTNDNIMERLKKTWGSKE